MIGVHRPSALALPGFCVTATLALLITMPSNRAVAQSVVGAAYTLSNQSTGNAVLVFRRSTNGALSPAGSFATGGTGLGSGSDPLGSQGAVVLDQSNRLLFAVNAGSNDVSAFAVN